MKNLKLSIVVLLAIGSISYGGGDISPVTDYEIEDAVVADEEAYPMEDTSTYVEDEAYIEPIVEERPEYVEPIPVATPMPTPEPIATKQPKQVIVPKPRKISTNGLYVGLGITGVRYKDSCHCSKNIKVTNKDTTYGVMGRVGYDFNQYIGVEARASKTNWGSDGTRVEHAGIYLKPMMPISNSTNIYGLVGAGKTKVKGSMPHLDSEALALGGGVEIDLSQDTPKDGRYSRSFDGQGDQERGLGVFVDYERLVAKKHAPRLDAVSAGVSYDF